ncbi:cytochrome oxidase c assembly domain-containing protein [Trichoderma novae-zelandiae]
MASRIGPRSVKDATRFTSTVPHATSKSATSGPSAASRIPGETPEQRVQRLRQAHLAAQRAQVSKADKVIDASRRFFDMAHRWTVGGLVIFTAVAGVVSVYSVWDMLRYNRARRAEWIEAQRKFEADELSTARLAYLRGDATEEQIALVEEANREAEAKGIRLPPLLSPPEHRTHFEEHVKPAFDTGKAAEAKGKGILGFIWGGSDTDSASASTSTGTENNSASAIVQDAWEKEKANQRNGGSLDQLGLETGSAAPEPKKKGWW